jgi:hypothetical protein
LYPRVSLTVFYQLFIQLIKDSFSSLFILPRGSLCTSSAPLRLNFLSRLASFSSSMDTLSQRWGAIGVLATPNRRKMRKSFSLAKNSEHPLYPTYFQGCVSTSFCVGIWESTEPREVSELVEGRDIESPAVDVTDHLGTAWASLHVQNSKPELRIR